MTWRFFLFVIVGMETSKNLFFFNTGQKTIFAKNSQLIWKATVFFIRAPTLRLKCRVEIQVFFLSFSSRLVGCSMRTLSFKVLPQLLMNFSIIGTILLSCLLYSYIILFLGIQYIRWFYDYHLFFFLIFLPVAPVFHSIIASVVYPFNLVLLKNTCFGHCAFNKELIA